jgi:hypothetical protein
MRLIRMAIGFCIALASVSWADSPTTTQSATTQSVTPTPQVLQLVSDLTSNQFSVRESAQQNLEKLGDSAVPQLESILAGPLPDEARARISVIIARIREARQFGPSIITIHCHDAPLADVLKDFAHQSGDVDLGLDRPEIQDFLNSHKITLDLDHADFWTALQAVQDAGGLRVRPDANGQMIFDHNGFFFLQGGLGADRAHSCISGPCLITPQNITWSMQFNSRRPASFLNVQLMAMVEPKIHLSGGPQADWIRECVDENGHSLVPQGISGFNGMRQWWIPLSVNLRVAPGMGTKIARLKGELTFTVRIKSETIEIDNLLSAHNVTRTAGGGSLTVVDCKSENGQYQLQLQGTGPRGSSFEQLFQNPMGSSMQVLDILGQPLQPMTASRTNDVGNMWSLTYGFPTFRPAKPPQRLQWEITTESRRINVPFELDDIDLLPPEILKNASQKSK